MVVSVSGNLYAKPCLSPSHSTSLFGGSHGSPKVGQSNFSQPFLRTAARTVAQAQQRPTWLPGLEPPSYLDGKLPGDFGFDPLGLGEDPESLRWYVQANLFIHALQWLELLGFFSPTWLLRVTGIRNLPVWFEAGAVKYEFVETKRYMDFINPGSQAKSPFFGIEASLEGIEPGYPGGPLLNPLGLAKDIKNAHDWKLKEIKNGRLAMVAMLGFFVQASVTHVGPVENLIGHLSDPWHRTIVQTLAGSSHLQ
ncbi:unnamed protein product [Rhodiola kirilowii]